MVDKINIDYWLLNYSQKINVIQDLYFDLIF